MKYLTALITALSFLVTPVYANEPVKKGNLMLAKKKDHNKAAAKPTQPAKKAEKKAKK
jgi:hypothetical protein